MPGEWGWGPALRVFDILSEFRHFVAAPTERRTLGNRRSAGAPPQVSCELDVVVDGSAFSHDAAVTLDLVPCGRDLKFDYRAGMAKPTGVITSTQYKKLSGDLQKLVVRAQDAASADTLGW
ncbi:MAG: hypothetical protein HRU17_07185 [Polyangiaceae bacterium]|nr:hypothetical protein [Polyangiaceae bacterium]